MADGGLVRLDHEGAASTLMVDRPGRLNALDRELLGRLRDALEEEPPIRIQDAENFSPNGYLK